MNNEKLAEALISETLTMQEAVTARSNFRNMYPDSTKLAEALIKKSISQNARHLVTLSTLDDETFLKHLAKVSILEQWSGIWRVKYGSRVWQSMVLFGIPETF